MPQKLTHNLDFASPIKKSPSNSRKYRNIYTNPLPITGRLPDTGYLALQKDWLIKRDETDVEGHRKTYVQDTRAITLLEELLHIGTEGLFLVSGKKGVGKTTQVNQAIKQMKEKEEREGRQVLVVKVDASNFEMIHKSGEDGKNVEIDPSKTKLSILQNLSLQLANTILEKPCFSISSKKGIGVQMIYDKFRKKILRKTNSIQSLNLEDNEVTQNELAFKSKVSDLQNRAEAKKRG